MTRIPRHVAFQTTFISNDDFGTFSLDFGQGAVWTAPIKRAHWLTSKVKQRIFLFVEPAGNGDFGALRYTMSPTEARNLAVDLLAMADHLDNGAGKQ